MTEKCLDFRVSLSITVFHVCGASISKLCVNNSFKMACIQPIGVHLHYMVAPIILGLSEVGAPKVVPTTKIILVLVPGVNMTKSGYFHQ